MKNTLLSTAKIFSLLAVMLVVLFVIWVTELARSDRYNPVTEFATEETYDVVAFGDSLIEGLGARPGEDFIALLEDRLDISILNLGRRGDTTEEALERIDQVLAFEPKIVLISLGGNDVLHGINIAERLVNLEQIIQTLQTTDADIVMLGVRTGVWKDTYERDVMLFAEQQGVIYIPDVLSGILFNPVRLSDPIHPNSRGHEVLADRIEPVLRTLLEQK